MTASPRQVRSHHDRATGWTFVGRLWRAGRDGWRWWAGSAAIGLALLWGASQTETGYFFLHRSGLRQAIADIAATPAITSLDLGQEDRLTRGGRFDSYRFINATLITHFRAQAAPQAAQAVLFIDDMLRQLGVSHAAYMRLRHDLEGLGMTSFARDTSGQVSFTQPQSGGTPWDDGLVYSPSGGLPTGSGVQGSFRLAPHWFHVVWG